MASMAPTYTVEVRDVNFVRLGQIAPEYLDLKFTEVFRGVGSWEMKLPAEHPQLANLKTKGAGIIITETWEGGSKIYSGRMRTAVLDQSATDPKGTWTISGADDGILAAATVVYPDPASLATAQTAAYWNYASNGESVMKQAVYLNAGTGAIVSRRYSWLTVATSLNRGTAASANARFDVLGDLLQAVGAQSGLGWKFYQSGATVVFDVTVPRDLTDTVRLDIVNGGLESSQLGYTAPSATNVLVLGQGEGADRTVINVTTTPATTDATAWGLRWEQTKDQRNTDDTTELTQAGTEIISESGTTVNSLKVSPSDAPGQRLGQDWGLGDKITVVLAGQETEAVVAQIATAIGPAGVIKQATVGDPVGYDWEAKVGATIKDQGKRLDRLENYIDTNPILPAPTPPGALSMYAGPYTTIPTDWLLADGAAVSRTTYANLFAAIGTTYGTGNGTTTFNLPNMRGRVPVGIDVGGATAFDTRGKSGGATTHTLVAGEMPSHTHVQDSHNHTQNSHNHTQNSHNHTQDAHSHSQGANSDGFAAHATGGSGFSSVLQNTAAGEAFFYRVPASTTATNQATTATNVATTATNIATTATNQNTGGGGAHNNLQPYLVVNYIIKT